MIVELELGVIVSWTQDQDIDQKVWTASIEVYVETVERDLEDGFTGLYKLDAVAERGPDSNLDALQQGGEGQDQVQDVTLAASWLEKNSLAIIQISGS